MANQGTTNQVAGNPVTIGATLDCKQLTTDRIPDLVILPQRTAYASNSSQRFLPQMLEWETFEEEVRDTFRHMLARPDFQGDTMSFNQPDCYTNEQVSCGNEIGVVGRFQQHIGHVMTMVLQHMRSEMGNKSLRFGDWRPPGPGGPAFYPDLAIYNDVGQGFPAHVLVIGEAKTPWTVNLQSARAGYVSGDLPYGYERIVGQVANYMKVHGKQYGFITTYLFTIFFKQAPAPSGNGTVLYHSHAISHQTPSHRGGNVSVRECMLFIARVSSENSDYANYETRWTEPIHTGPKSTGPKSTGAAGPGDGRSRGGQGGGKFSGGPPSGSGMQQGKSRGGGFSQRQQLQNFQDPTDTVAPIGVKWSNKDNWFYAKNPNEEPRRVDGYKFLGDRLEVKIDGINKPLCAIIRS